MCGIAGIYAPRSGERRGDGRADIVRMTATLAHRGPNAQGQWLADDGVIALGHTRLSILDLSPAGAQPMVSHCGRYRLVYNGEIYNAAELRRRLEEDGERFRGHSDTEVLLAALAQWGIERTLRMLDGMFAFALWDLQARRLVLARDRLGEKPLYYGWHGAQLLFASELKAMHVMRPRCGRQSPEHLPNLLAPPCLVCKQIAITPSRTPQSAVAHSVQLVLRARSDSAFRGFR